MDSAVVARRGIATRRDIKSAVYSDSIVDVAIDVCRQATQRMGHHITSIMLPVLDLTEFRLVPSSSDQPQAKAASIYTSVVKASSNFLWMKDESFISRGF